MTRHEFTSTTCKPVNNHWNGVRKMSQKKNTSKSLQNQVFFNCRCVVHKEFLPKGQIVKKEYYLSIMRRLRESIYCKRPELWKENFGFYTRIMYPFTEPLLWMHFDKKSNYCHRIRSVFTCRLFSVPQTAITSSWKAFWLNSVHQTKVAEGAQRHPEKCLQKVFWWVCWSLQMWPTFKATR